MRFEELHLERFGRFEGLKLDLSGEDVRLHVVYGPNEAGKSTALTAICDLLFGIHERTPYAFMHEYGRLRIGATIVNAAGQCLSFKRRKARTNSLLRANESSELSDGSLAPFLGGVSRELFERMFGLNHDRLRSGGKAMLDAGGDLARSLFEAGSGTVGLAPVSRALGDEADAIGSPTRKSSTRPYWKAHERFDEANERIRREALKADAWKGANMVLDEACGRLKALQEELADCHRRRSACERIRRVLPLLRRIDDLAAELADLANVPHLPDGFEETWLAATQAQRSALDAVMLQQEHLERLQQDREALGEPGAWMLVAKRIDELGTDLGDYRSKRHDLPHRLRDLENGRKQMLGLIRDLGADINPDHVGDWVPSEQVVSRVRSLIAEWHRLETAAATAAKELDETETALQRAQAEAKAAGEPSDPSEAISALDAALIFGDVASRVEAARTAVAHTEPELGRAMNLLGRWHEGSGLLAATPFPSIDTVARFEQQFDKIAAEREARSDELERLQGELRRIEGELEGLLAAGDVPTPEAVLGARRRRNNGWRLVRRRYVDGFPMDEGHITEFAPSGELVEAFEASISAADDLTDRREREVARIERHASLIGQRSRTLSDIKEVERQIAALGEREQAGQQKWAELWCGIDVDLGSPTDMRGWLAKKDETLLWLQKLETAQKERDLANGELERATQHLRRAATALKLEIGDKPDFLTLRERIKTACERAKAAWMQAADLRREVTTRTADRDERRHALEQVEQRIKAWHARWVVDVPALGIAATSSHADAETALSVWSKIRQLEADLTQTRLRRQQIEDVIGKYELNVQAALRDLGEAVGDLDVFGDVSTLVPTLHRRLTEVRQLAARIADADKGLATARASTEAAQNSLHSAEAKLQHLRVQYGLAPDVDVIELARRSRSRRDLEGELRRTREVLAQQGDGRDEAALRVEAKDADADAILAEIERLEGEISSRQTSLQDATKDVTLAEGQVRALQNREGIGEAAQAANDAAAEMVGFLERWLRLKAASFVLNRAVERYREANQHPLVKRASEIFAAVAGSGDNPIVRLSVDYTDEERPTLVGYRRDGSLCPVSGMSEGTADQLYLALRIAVVERHAAAGEPIPFIADDLFITSDEERTRPGVRALSELGRHTQVLLFTHHRYVVDAARLALAPEKVRIHSLQTSVTQDLEVAV